MKRAIAILWLASLVAMAAGFAREAVTAYLFGTSPEADAFALILYYADALSALVLAGLGSYVLVPVVTRLRARDDPKAAFHLLGTLLLWTCLIAVPLLGLGLWQRDAVVRLIAPEFTASQRLPLLELIRNALPASLLILVSGAIFGVLQGFGTYAPSAFGRVVFSLAIAMALLLAAPTLGIRAGGSGLLAGAGLQCCLAGLALYRVGWRPRMPRWWHPELVRALNLALPTLIALVLTNLVMGGVQRLVASGLEPGGLAAVNYAQRAVSLISGVTVSVATVSVTELSMRAATDASWQPTIDLLGRTLQASLYLLVPLAALVILVSDPLVTLLFVRGEYTAESASTTSACLRWLALSVAPSVIPAVLHRACSVFDRPWRVPLISLLWTASTVGATALLLQPLGAASLTAGHAVGIAAATLFSALAVREFVGTPFLLMLGRSFVRFSLFSLVAAVPAAMYLSLAHAEETGWSAGSAALGMVVASVIFMGAYAGLSYLVREPQLAAFWSAARALTSRSSNPI